MSKKKGEGLKSFNRGFNVPDTYIIIFFVVVIAAVMTFLVPKGYYETEDVTSNERCGAAGQREKDRNHICPIARKRYARLTYVNCRKGRHSCKR